MTVSQDAGDVGEPGSVGDLDIGQLWPAFLSPGVELVASEDLVDSGTVGMPPMVDQASGTVESCSACRHCNSTAARDNGVVTSTSSPVLNILTDRDRAELES